MHSVSNYLSIKQQKILLLLFNGSGSVNFTTQSEYKNQAWFNKAMKPLLKLEWLTKKFVRLNGHFGNEYTLTTEGRMVVNFTFSKMVSL